jgi:cell division protein FtsI/penicillin-binding protein 2
MKSWRINIVLSFIIIFAALILGRLIDLQLLDHKYWQALAQGQQKFFVSSQGERGEIFFKDNTPLAINRSVDLVYAVPLEIENLEKTTSELSSVLNLSQDLIMEKIQNGATLKKGLSEEESKKLKELNLSGIRFGKEMVRYYPFESMAAQTVGFLGGDGKGQYGLEGFYENLLKGEDGILQKEKGPGGFFINLNKSLKNGADIILTLDYNVQFFAEKLLSQAKENLDIERGEIIVINPNSGEVMALATFPNFNLNEYSKIRNFEIFKNSSLNDLFEPGSVFKSITMAAALDQGKITPQTTYVDPGVVKIGNYTISNYDNRRWGQRTMTEVLEKSINTGSVFAEKQLGHNLFLEYVEKFGFFAPTGIDLQGEVFSQNKELKKGYEINFATASFGQGIEITSFQLVRAYSAIANRGKLIKPFLVKKILQDNKVIEIKPQIQNPSVISEDAASQLTLMLVSTVENGFSGRAKIPGYYIAGKTGTAQVPYENKKGYYPDKTIQSFIGFAPAFNPQFLILVKLYNPKSKTAEYSAVPIFREMAKYLLDYLQIPPDYDIQNKSNK